MTFARRFARSLGRTVAVVLLALGLAEVLLRGVALFARDRGERWRSGATHRILCVGDSHTYGALVPPEESYPGHLQRLLDERDPGAYSVVNLGIPGMNTTLVRERLRAVLARERPDRVLVWCGVNDAWNRTEPGAATAGVSIEQLLLRLRLYRLVRTWWQDRRLESALAQILPSGQQRYHVLFQMDPATEEHQRLTVLDGQGSEQIAYEDTGFRADAAMRERAERDYRGMIEDCRSAGVPIAFITYPVEADAFAVANAAIRSVASAHGVPVVESGPAVARVPPEDRELLWAGHPNGAMYGEIARDVLRVVREDTEGTLAELRFDADPLPTGTVVAGPCTRATTGCAEGAGCYRWNPTRTTCNVRQDVIGSSGAPVLLSARVRATALPSDGGRDLLGVLERTYGTGIFVQVVDRDRLQLLAMGGGGATATCPLGASLAPGVWYDVRVRAEKSDAGRATIELRDAEGAVVDAATCEDLPTGGGTFTTLSVGSLSPLATTADVTIDAVSVREAPDA